MQASRFYVITGGTMVHVAPHFSLCAPAYGSVGNQIYDHLPIRFAALSHSYGRGRDVRVHLLPTRMAGEAEGFALKVFKAAGINFLETNDDLEKLIDYLLLQPDTKGIILAAAVCDWEPHQISTTGHETFGKRRPRLRTSEGNVQLTMRPSAKIIGKIRRERKDIFLVGFKATTGMAEQEQYLTGLGLLKSASCNLVFSNDLHTHVNMVITPEEAKYHVGDRKTAMRGLCDMIVMRSGLQFTRSTVVPGEPVAWDDEKVPANLRKVVNHCIQRGAYKPFQGKTVGHFATRGETPGVIYTSRRKSNFNHLPEDGLLRIETVGEDQVIAHGAKPSVGGQSQRIIFDQHPDVDCIVHAHVPLRTGALLDNAIRPQYPYECGSHECGENTSKGLREIVPGIKVVMLDEHGPNICFSRETPPDRVIQFIEDHFDLERKTGGPVSLES